MDEVNEMAKILGSKQKKYLEFSIHPYALPAFEFFNQSSLLVNKTKMERQALIDLNVGLPLQGVFESNHLQIVSGFEFISFSLAELDLSVCEVIIHSNLANNDIAQKAWSAVIRSLLTSLDPHQLELTRRALNESAPKSVLNSVFGKNKLSQSCFAEITHLSRSTLAQQYSKAEGDKLLVQEEVPTIFSLLQQKAKSDLSGIKN